ncbi:MAG: hypothetical protein H7A41_02025 [Chlamydiales bacterium]|nr:hypothetical protein [Chlamydiales bacterium]
MTTVEGVSAQETSAAQIEESEAIHPIDIKISNTARPKICAEFQEIDFQNRMIILSDGSNWKISQRTPNTTLSKVVEVWKKGDDIRLARYYQGVYTGFVMYNVRLEQALLVQSSRKCADISKAFFIAEVDKSGYALKTTDGKIWITGFAGSFSVRRWQEGQRVIVNQGIHSKNDYTMIHPDSQTNAWVTEVFRKTAS